MELPKQLAAEDIEAEVRAALERERIPLGTDSGMLVASVRVTPELRQQLFYAKSIGEVTIGLEDIAKVLANELRGLQNVDGQSCRVSRVLLVTNDGSPRFYRDVEFLHGKQGGRVMVVRMDAGSALIGNVLGLKSKQVKAVLLNRKTAVVNVLRSLL